MSSQTLFVLALVSFFTIAICGDFKASCSYDEFEESFTNLMNINFTQKRPFPNTVENLKAYAL